MIYKCPKCGDTKMFWKLEDENENGDPVCPKCNIVMETKEQKAVQDKIEESDRQTSHGIGSSQKIEPANIPF